MRRILFWRMPRLERGAIRRLCRRRLQPWMRLSPRPHQHDCPLRGTTWDTTELASSVASRKGRSSEPSAKHFRSNVHVTEICNRAPEPLQRVEWCSFTTRGHARKLLIPLGAEPSPPSARLVSAAPARSPGTFAAATELPVSRRKRPAGLAAFRSLHSIHATLSTSPPRPVTVPYGPSFEGDLVHMLLACSEAEAIRRFERARRPFGSAG